MELAVIVGLESMTLLHVFVLTSFTFLLYWTCPLVIAGPDTRAQTC